MKDQIRAVLAKLVVKKGHDFSDSRRLPDDIEVVLFWAGARFDRDSKFWALEVTRKGQARAVQLHPEDMKHTGRSMWQRDQTHRLSESGLDRMSDNIARVFYKSPR